MKKQTASAAFGGMVNSSGPAFIAGLMAACAVVLMTGNTAMHKKAPAPKPE